MDRKQALNQLRLMQAWHEDFGNGPNADYDAICVAIEALETQPNLETLIKALEQEHKKLLEMQKALKNVPDMNVGDTISRQAALDIFDDYNVAVENGQIEAYSRDRKRLCDLPSAQPEPCEDAVSRAAIMELRRFVDNNRFGGPPVEYVDLYDISKLPPVTPKQTEQRCVWCDSPFRIEYYWIDREGNTASFQDEERHIVATGIANFCPNCGAKMKAYRKEV